MTPLERQLADLKAAYPTAEWQQGPMGLTIAIPDFKLMPVDAWNKPTTTLRIVAPIGFPQAQPDCFWVDADVRLSSGAMPTNSSINTQLGLPLLWFSWHVQRWSPNNDTLQTYLRVVKTRLQQPT